MVNHRFLELRSAGGKGRGVFTSRPIKRREAILTFGGEMMTLSQIEDFTHVIQIGPARFLGPSGSLDDYVNHSCEPNCGLRNEGARVSLFALQRIERGEELTFDYSTCVLDEPDLGACYCGAPSCRGVIGNFRDLPSDLQHHYLSLGALPRFLRRSLESARVDSRV